MKFTLEVVCVPVGDVDRAKAFYAEQMGFEVDFDSDTGTVRFVQLTRPGLAAPSRSAPASPP
jgi:catechol 2,3-dioxygenase-like lactoylglutathione lyase family enzyme